MLSLQALLSPRRGHAMLGHVGNVPPGLHSDPRTPGDESQRKEGMATLTSHAMFTSALPIITLCV